MGQLVTNSPRFSPDSTIDAVAEPRTGHPRLDPYWALIYPNASNTRLASSGIVLDCCW